MCDFEVQKSRLLGEPTASRSDRNFAFPDFSSYQSSFLGSKIVVIRVFFQYFPNIPYKLWYNLGCKTV